MKTNKKKVKNVKNSFSFKYCSVKYSGSKMNLLKFISEIITVAISYFILTQYHSLLASDIFL